MELFNCSIPKLQNRFSDLSIHWRTNLQTHKRFEPDKDYGIS